MWIPYLMLFLILFFRIINIKYTDILIIILEELYWPCLACLCNNLLHEWTPVVLDAAYVAINITETAATKCRESYVLCFVSKHLPFVIYYSQHNVI